jgi:hypothetical protein
LAKKTSEFSQSISLRNAICRISSNAQQRLVTVYLTILPLATFTNAETFSAASFTAGGATTTLQQAVDNFTEYPGFPATPPAQPYWEKITMVSLDSNGNPFPLDSISPVVGNSFTATFLANGTTLPIPGVFR